MNNKKNYLISFLNKFDDSSFIVNYKNKDYHIGTKKPVFKVLIKNNISKKNLLRSTSLALAESYMKGDIEIEGDLFNALDHFLAQISKFSRNNLALHELIHTSLSKENQKEEVCSHYDIGNDFYKLWLDETLSYSCGYFKSENDSLLNAQKNKIDYTLKKLYLKENMSVLDIGCGYGSMLITAYKKYNIKGLGITLSKEQYKEFKDRIKKEGLEDKLEVKLMDYRELINSDYKFDRIVSVGMIEHVGRDNYDLFMQNVNHVLKSKGIFLLHFISSLKEYPGNPFIKKYIFPGGVIPSLREVTEIVADYDFHILNIENLRYHYFKTLMLWDKNFNIHRKEIEKDLGIEFARMWDLYLCSCAAAFHNGIVDLHQVLMVKNVDNELPLTKWF